MEGALLGAPDFPQRVIVSKHLAPFQGAIIDHPPTRGGALTRLPLATFFHPFGMICHP